MPGSTVSRTVIGARSQGSPGDAFVSFKHLYVQRKIKLESACLAFLVVCQPLWIELLDHLLWGIVLPDLAVKIETNHIARVDFARQFEELGQTLLFCLLNVLRRHVNDEVHVDVIVVFFVVLPGTHHRSPTMAGTQFNVP